MIFAGIDVTLQGNARAIEAGPDMYLWTWIMLWMRDQKGDGFVPEDVVLGASWGGPIAGRVKRNRAAAKVLTAAGLLIAVDGGWLVRNYVAKNDTKEIIEARIESNRKRQEAFKNRKRSASTDFTSNETREDVGNALPKRVTAGAGAGAGVSSESPEGMQGGPPLTDTVRPMRTGTDAGVGMTEAAAWAEGCAAAGRPLSVPDRFDRERIARVANAMAPTLSGNAMAEWIRNSAEDYATASVGHEEFWQLTVPRWKAWVETGSKPIGAAGRGSVAHAVAPAGGLKTFRPTFRE